VPTQFDLKGLARDCIKESDSADPHVIAAEMLEEIPGNRLREVLGMLLPDYVRQELGKERRAVLRKSRKAKKGSKRWSRAKELATTDEFRLWDTSFYVPSTGSWKFFRELDRSDVAEIATNYDNIAANNAAWADSFEELGKAMKRQRATFTNDLPTATVRKIFEPVEEEIEEDDE
jgi:hypothetical protein